MPRPAADDSKKAAATKLLREMLLTKYEPGTPISESEVVKLLGDRFSRQPIRYALAVLEREGLIVIRPSRGCLVRLVSAEEAEELQDARKIIESHCVAKVAQIAANQGAAAARDLLLDAYSAMGKMERIAQKSRPSEQDVVQFAETDLDFHVGIASAAGYPTTFCQWLIDARNRFRLIAAPTAIEFKTDTIEEHHEILAAILDGDPQLAQQKLAEHLENAKPRWRLRVPKIGPYGRLLNSAD